jgi:AcrR family transcriptional regulator
MREPDEPGASTRREEILDAATRLFAERGYAGASLADIAERVGIRKASLFYHFDTKEAIYAAVLDRLVGSLREPLERIYDRGGSYAERLDAVTETIVMTLGSDAFAARLLVREAMDQEPGRALSPFLEGVVQVLEAGAAWIRAGQDAGEFAADDPKQVVLTALGVHLMPFAVSALAGRFMGVGAFKPAFVVARLGAVRRHMRAMHLKRP